MHNFKVPENKAETADDRVTTECRIFSDKVGVPLNAANIEVAHRVGQRSSTGSRSTRNRQILRPREEGRGSQEPTQSQEESVCCWRRSDLRKLPSVHESDGTFGNPGSVETQREDSGQSQERTDCETEHSHEAFKRAMSSNEMSADEDN